MTEVKLTPTRSGDQRATAKLSDLLTLSVSKPAALDTWFGYVVYCPADQSARTICASGGHATLEDAHAGALAQLALLRDEIRKVLP
jgi:hypothetical protein